jgi:uncharacterized protein
MKQDIPEKIKLFKFATRGLSFNKKYKLRDFQRVSMLASNLDDTVNVDLSFFLEKNNIPCVMGKIELKVIMTCQRCLGDVDISLKPKFKLAYLHNEQQGDEIDSSYETILIKDEELSSIEFITDEILISIPMIPMHINNCSIGIDKEILKNKKIESPFAILKQIKTKPNKQE